LPGTAVLREELALCLLEAAADDRAWSVTGSNDSDGTKALKATRRAALVTALKQRGIDDPAATLKAVRLQAVENEKNHPEQSAQLWRSQALAKCAPSDFLASLFQSFDTTMARTTASFSSEAQVYASVTALVLVIVMQVNAIELIKRLSVDETYRRTLNAEAQALTSDRLQKLEAFPSCKAATDVDKCIQAQQDDVREKLELLRSPTFDLTPKKTLKELSAPSVLLGMVLAWLLISLGAPFWFDVLKNGLKLRSLLAQKDDADRQERDAAASKTAQTLATAATTAAATAAGQTPGQPDGGGTTASTTPSTTTTTTTTKVDADLGEMGDLAATGAQG
jgi:hypothetical protein